MLKEFEPAPVTVTRLQKLLVPYNARRLQKTDTLSLQTIYPGEKCIDQFVTHSPPKIADRHLL